MIQNLKALSFFIRDVFKSRRIIYELSKQDFKSRYLGSYLGILWAFIHPSVYIIILWFVFQFGFRSEAIDNFPYILWLMTSMISWMFFSDCISNASSSIIDHSYLVKKVVFRVSILPIIKVLSALVIHLFFIVILIILFQIYGFSLHIYALQILYYLFSGIVLILGLSWITSSLIVFVKDIRQIVTVSLQFTFWLTPIFWSTKLLPEKYLFLIKLNPIFYIVEGYRNSFINEKWFWENPLFALYFWGLTVFILFTGALLFKKLRPHFADVL